MVPKFPNCLWDQLAEDRLSASFIVDGLHLDPLVPARGIASEIGGADDPGHGRGGAGRSARRAAIVWANSMWN